MKRYSARLLAALRGSNRSRLLSAIVLLCASIVFLVFYSFAQQTDPIPLSTVHQATYYEKATVVAVLEEDYRNQQEFEDVLVGTQALQVEIDTGEYAGQQFQLTNNLSYLYGTLLEAGDPLTLAITIDEGQISSITLQDYDRTLPLLIVLLLFVAATVLVGRGVGAKSLLGLGLTILCLFAVMIPLLLQGWPTIPTILGMCAFVTVVEFVILGGVNRKTICAILGTISGVVLAAAFGQLACWLTRIDGYRMYSAESTVEALLQIKQTQDPAQSLQIKNLLVGGILIAALGAVNDVAMSISSAVHELAAVNPSLRRRDLWRSGMNIGRDMVGTMTNTLILAFLGSSLVMMIYLSSLQVTFHQLFASTWLSVEVVTGVASSIGVILSVPLTCLIAACLYGSRAAEKTK